MSFDKISRARCIVGSLQAMAAMQYGKRAKDFPADEIFSVAAPGQWSGTITRRCNSTDYGTAGLAPERWSLAHIHIQQQMVLAVRFHQDQIELLRYIPGQWERWFGLFDATDTQTFPSA